MRTRRRLSLYGRMGLAVGVLASFGVFLTGFFILLCLVALVVTAPFLLNGYALVTQAPRLSGALGAPPAAAAGVAAAYLVVTFRYAAPLTDRLGIEYIYWPTDPISGLTAGLAVVAVYEVAVETTVAVGRAFTANPTWGVAFAVGVAAVCGVYVSVGSVRHELRRLRQGSVAAVADREPDDRIVDRAIRLAALADVPAPAVRLRETDRPYAYTVGVRDRTIVLSSGLVDRLDPAELDAVLAHEIGHIANRDVTVMAAALAPVLVAEEVHADDGTVASDRGDPGERAVAAVLDAITGGLLWYGQRGAGVLSRGREYAADVAAAELTGRPAALADALRTLREAPERPSVDLRDTEAAVAALNIVPPPRDARLSVATHPSTADRIAVLRSIERTQERV